MNTVMLIAVTIDNRDEGAQEELIDVINASRGVIGVEVEDVQEEG